MSKRHKSVCINFEFKEILQGLNFVSYLHILLLIGGNGRRCCRTSKVITSDFFIQPNIPLEVKKAKCKKHCLFLLYQKLWPFQTLAQFMWSKQETGDLSTTIWCKIIDLRSNTGKTSPFHFWYFQYSKIKSPPGPIWLTFPITLQIFHKNVAKGTSDPRWVLWLIQHLEFKAEASTSFEMSVKLQLGFVWKRARNPRTN